MMNENITKNILIKLNLQFFAEGAGGEKTELPTEKKKKETMKEGQFAKSMEINTAMLIIFSFFSLKIFIPYMYDKIVDLFNHTFSLLSKTDEIFSISYMSSFLTDMFARTLIAVLPITVVCLIVGVIANVVQIGWHPTLKPIQPKLSRINPLEGFKRIFSMRSVMELMKSLLKLVLICAILYVSISSEIKILPAYMNMSIVQSTLHVGNVVIDTALKIGILFVVLAIIDYSYQRFEHMKKIKMSKYEVRKEYEQEEGKPEIKQKIKQRMRQISMRRMMNDVPKADVIITNPTHYAIAVKYDQKKDAVPRVVAKGTDFLAKRIKEVAIENKVEIVENKPLARTLYATVEIGEEIPEELFGAVAEILAFVYKLKNKV
ncbi:MAG TPA: flagellar biosynthesis protein FlhB [Clostridiales bacterium]|nr:flagellar biosynthesis protein FlhB [Clostridiales bacterium]